MHLRRKRPPKRGGSEAEWTALTEEFIAADRERLVANKARRAAEEKTDRLQAVLSARKRELLSLRRQLADRERKLRRLQSELDASRRERDELAGIDRS